MTKQTGSARKAKFRADRDPDFRALRMCDKYLFAVCTPRMRRATLEFLASKLSEREREAGR
jgi:hypothetical protein